MEEQIILEVPSQLNLPPASDRYTHLKKMYGDDWEEAAKIFDSVMGYDGWDICLYYEGVYREDDDDDLYCEWEDDYISDLVVKNTFLVKLKFENYDLVDAYWDRVLRKENLMFALIEVRGNDFLPYLTDWRYLIRPQPTYKELSNGYIHPNASGRRNNRVMTSYLCFGDEVIPRSDSPLDNLFLGLNWVKKYVTQKGTGAPYVNPDFMVMENSVSRMDEIPESHITMRSTENEYPNLVEINLSMDEFGLYHVELSPGSDFKQFVDDNIEYHPKLYYNPESNTYLSVFGEKYRNYLKEKFNESVKDAGADGKDHFVTFRGQPIEFRIIEEELDRQHNEVLKPKVYSVAFKKYVNEYQIKKAIREYSGNIEPGSRDHNLSF